MVTISRKGAFVMGVLGLLAVPAYAQTGAGTESSQQVKSMSAGDEATAKRVNAALQADPKSYYRHVTVVAQNGVVTLGGLVTGDASRARAKQIASSVQGVSKVIDQMEVQPKGETNGSGGN